MPVVPDYGKQMVVCKESVLLPNHIPAHNEGALGTSLRRQVEEWPYERSCQALEQPLSPTTVVLSEIWQPDCKGLLQIFGYEPHDFPTIMLQSSPPCLRQSSPDVDVSGECHVLNGSKP